LSDNGDVDVDLIGDGGDYKIRLEYQRIKFCIFFDKKKETTSMFIVTNKQINEA
jgi:hypothetical protein